MNGRISKILRKQATSMANELNVRKIWNQGPPCKWAPGSMMYIYRKMKKEYREKMVMPAYNHKGRL